MTYTPGPWVVEQNGGKGAWIAGSTGEWAALACGDSNATAEANARLIAAAPEMLEALLLAEKLYQDGLFYSDAGDIRRVTELRRAAIAKVTGE